MRQVRLPFLQMLPFSHYPADCLEISIIKKLVIYTRVCHTNLVIYLITYYAIYIIINNFKWGEFGTPGASSACSMGLVRQCAERAPSCITHRITHTHIEKSSRFVIMAHKPNCEVVCLSTSFSLSHTHICVSVITHYLVYQTVYKSVGLVYQPERSEG